MRVRERERERDRARVPLGLLGIAVRGMRGEERETTSAGTSSPSFRRNRSRVVRFCVASDGTSERDEPEWVEGALDTSEGAVDKTEPLGVKENGSTLTGVRCVGLRLPQVDPAVERVSVTGTDAVCECNVVAMLGEGVEQRN